MNEANVLADVVNKLTNKPILISVLVKPKSKLHKLLMKLRLSPKSHDFELTPILVGNMYRISAKAVQIPDDVFSRGVIESFMTSSFSHLDKLIYIVAVGLQNNSKEPSKSLIKLIENEFTAKDIAGVFNAIMSQIDVTNFMNSIISIKGSQILVKTSQ